MKKLFIAFIIVVCTTMVYGQEKIDLSGKWGFSIDRNDNGTSLGWTICALSDSINLPGSMPEKLKGDDITINTKWTASLYDSSYYINPRMAEFRKEGNIKLPFFLTPDKHYVGAAWYMKDVKIPNTWRNKRIVFVMERPHTETTVYVDGKKAGSQNSLCVAHEYDLTSYLTPGNHHIAVCVDNRIKDVNVGPDSHSITDQTQGNWNGIVGEIALLSTPKTFFDDIQVYPNLAEKKAVVKIKVFADKKTNAKIQLEASSYNSPIKHDVPTIEQEVSLVPGENVIDMSLMMGDKMLTWDEFSPALYNLSASLSYGKQTDKRQVSFGMREFTIEGKYFYINGRKTILRGTVENCDFPLTGYAPMDVESWERVFRICRAYGLNHMRFHSFCPPKAAFTAADITGFYIQPEGPSWPNHGSSLGAGKPIDTYLLDETIRMNKEYGNHASFCMLACGNEPRGRWVEWVTKFVNYWKATDSRKVYTGASVGGSWQWQPANQYHVKAGARGLSWDKRAPQSMDDFGRQLDTVRQPFVSHETGQWCAFPNFEEINKYTGVNKAKNFEIFRTFLEEGGMGQMGHKFMMASGKLQALCYKYEIERTLRTPGYAGFQLLSLNDYSGQGTALVGVLDVFFGEKGYMNSSEFSKFCSPTVALARIPKFVYTNKEDFVADIEVSHFGAEPLTKASAKYTLRNSIGKIIESGNLDTRDYEIGNCQKTGTVKINLAQITKAEKLTLEVCIDGKYSNEWNFWVYPSDVNVSAAGIYVTDTLNEKTLSVLKNGGKVLILAAGKISYGKEIVQYFTPVFWNTSWFKMRPPHTTGIYTNPAHPLYRNFPTDYHSDLQWWELLNKAQVMRLTEFPNDFQPTIQNIDTWFLSRKSGVLFEANVCGGKLIMTSLDLSSNLDTRIVARQMYAALLMYMRSDAFRPTANITAEMVGELFTRKAPAIDFGTKGNPDELRPASSLLNNK